MALFPFTQFDFPNVSNYDSDLREIISVIIPLARACEDLTSWKNTHEEEYRQLKDFQNQILAGNFPPSVQQAFITWMQRNANDIIATMTTNVFFGLNSEGYFVAYVPDSWSEIIFGTSGLDDFPEGVDFGHLTLTY